MLEETTVHSERGGVAMADLSGFETFTKRMVPLGKSPYVTIQKRGLLSFNKAAHAALGEPEAVELLFNRAERVIAVRGVGDDVPHAYKFRHLGGHKEDPSTFIVGATAFTNHYDIPTEVSIRRPATEQDGVLLIDLKDEGVVVTGNRKPRRSTPGED
jgi:hypothetical protein